MSVSLDVRSTGLARAARVLGKLEHLRLDDLLDTVGQVVENQVKQRIVDQEGPPDGGSWAEYSDSYKKQKAGKGKLAGKGKGFLRLEGDLENSIQHVVSYHEVEIGSNLVYAAANQATRPYLGLTVQNEDDVEEAVADWMRKVAGVNL